MGAEQGSGGLCIRGLASRTGDCADHYAGACAVLWGFISIFPWI